jgi:hypothetical protein
LHVGCTEDLVTVGKWRKSLVFDVTNLEPEEAAFGGPFGI